jgi:hypothetical protein
MHAAALNPIETWQPAPQPPRPRHLRLVPEPASPDETPDQRWIERLTQSVVEVLAGQRAATTLVNAVSPVVYQALRSPSIDARLLGGKVTSVRAQPLSGDSIEVAAVVLCPQRTRAVALRLHRRHGRWRCVCVLVL